jgi:hypothetical protein
MTLRTRVIFPNPIRLAVILRLVQRYDSLRLVVLGFNNESLSNHMGTLSATRRKRLEREHALEVADAVKVIQLRRAESQHRPAGEESNSVDWSCRWIVNGHWRHQYHGSGKDRELIYVMPFVKGPEDKPLKVPTHTVYQVSR